jgi:uncharacterized iron-regulated membrane protein
MVAICGNERIECLPLGGIMVWFRKALILSHRYLGIALSLMFVMWFVTGIGMIYSRGMPRLTPQVRLSRLPALELANVKLGVSEAIEQSGLERPGRVTLFTVSGRPAYRFGNSATLFADTGEAMTYIDSAAALRIAGAFMNVPENKLRYAGELTEPDQWTITLTRQLPLYKITVEDGAGTHLYVSPELAEVVQVTTRGSRMLAWVSTIPHFLYFLPLRLTNNVWVRAVVWTSALACVLAVLGIALGFVQFRRSRPHIRYSGWMRWHYLTGLVFGVLTLTWAFSGLLSMEPWAWTEHDSVERGIRQAFSSADLESARFPALDRAALAQLLDGRALKEIEFANIFGEPFYIARTSPEDQGLVGWPDGGHQPYFVSRDPDAARLLISANGMKIVEEPFTTDLLVQRLTKANPHTPVLETASLNEYDSYYYSRDGQAPLPVVRIKLGDSNRTWVYLDPEVGQVVGQVNRYNRVERWLYNGLHTLDFSFLYYNRPLWDVAVIALSLGGTAVSLLGLVMGIKRVRRGFARL